MPNYQLSKIYAIKSPSCDAVYIGSTTKQYLSQRMTKHKSDYMRWFQGKMNWVSSFLLLSFEDAYIELIEEYPCNSKDQLNKRERVVMESISTCINSIRAFRTIEEYKQETNTCVKKWQKQNKLHINNYRREHRRLRKTLKEISPGASNEPKK